MLVCFWHISFVQNIYNIFLIFELLCCSQLTSGKMTSLRYSCFSTGVDRILSSLWIISSVWNTKKDRRRDKSIRHRLHVCGALSLSARICSHSHRAKSVYWLRKCPAKSFLPPSPSKSKICFYSTIYRTNGRNAKNNEQLPQSVLKPLKEMVVKWI